MESLCGSVHRCRGIQRQWTAREQLVAAHERQKIAGSDLKLCVIGAQRPKFQIALLVRQRQSLPVHAPTIPWWSEESIGMQPARCGPAGSAVHDPIADTIE